MRTWPALYRDTGIAACLLGGLCLMGSPAGAGTRFFAAGGANTHPCTEAQPCHTAQPFEADLQPGDRLLFKRGDTFTGTQFKLQPTQSGGADNPIVYGAYGQGAKPLFDSGDPTMAGGGGSDGLRARTLAWLVVEDLAFVGWGSALDLGGVRDVVIRRVSATGGSSEACVHIKQYGGTPSERVLLEDVELARCGVNSNGEGVYIGTNPGQDGAGDPTSDITLRRVSIHDHKEEGVEVKNCARRVVIEESRIVGQGSNVQNHGIALAPSSVDCPGQNGDHTVRRTVIEQSAARGIHVGTGATIEHNLLLRNGHPTNNAGIWVEDLPGDHHPVVIERNAIVQSKEAAIQVQESAQATTTVSGNLAWGNGSGNTPRPPAGGYPRPCCLQPAAAPAP